MRDRCDFGSCCFRAIADRRSARSIFAKFRADSSFPIVGKETYVILFDIMLSNRRTSGLYDDPTSPKVPVPNACNRPAMPPRVSFRRFMLILAEAGPVSFPKPPRYCSIQSERFFVAGW